MVPSVHSGPVVIFGPGPYAWWRSTLWIASEICRILYPFPISRMNRRAHASMRELVARHRWAYALTCPTTMLRSTALGPLESCEGYRITSVENPCICCSLSYSLYLTEPVHRSYEMVASHMSADTPTFLPMKSEYFVSSLSVMECQALASPTVPHVRMTSKKSGQLKQNMSSATLDIPAIFVAVVQSRFRIAVSMNR